MLILGGLLPLRRFRVPLDLADDGQTVDGMAAPGQGDRTVVLDAFFSSRCWSTEVVCVSGILCSPFALFCIIMPRPTGGYPSAAGSYHLIFCNFFVFFSSGI